MKNNLSKRDVQVVEAQEISNLFPWEVVEAPIFNERKEPIPNWKHLKRSDDNQILNVCRESYTPISNEEFSQVATELSELTNRNIVKSDDFAGGKKLIVFFEPEEGQVNDVRYSNRIILGNSHDGSSGMFIGLNNLVYRCNNQFNIANKRGLKIHHTINIERNTVQMLKAVEIYGALTGEIKETYLKLMSTKISQKVAERTIYNINDIMKGDDISTRKEHLLEQQFFALNKEAQELGWSAFTIFNAITSFTSHIMVAKDRDLNLINGAASKLNDKALYHSLQLCQ